MRDTYLFRLALGIEPPWVVAKSAFDATAKRLDIHLDFARGGRFACPQCGVAGCLQAGLRLGSGIEERRNVFLKSGTTSSNPSSSTGESANSWFL